MSDSVNKPIPEDDFDVELFARKIYSLWKGILGKLLYPFVLIFHKPLRLVIFGLLAVGMAVALKFVLPRHYEATMFVVPMNKGDLNVINLVYDLKKLAENKDDAMLASMLGLDSATTGVVKSIEAKPVWGNFSKDTVSLIGVTVVTTNPQIFPGLQLGLMKYLEENEHYARIKRLRIEEIKALQIKLGQEMTEIDSLKNLLVRSMAPRSAGGFVYGEPLDPVRVYDAGMNLYRQKVSLIWQENYTNNFEVVKPFVVGSKPSWPKLSYLLLYSGAVALLLLIVVNYRERKGS